MAQPRKECCLLCRNFLPAAPSDWKPSYEGQAYDVYHVRVVIRETEREQLGHCILNPVHVEVYTNHLCSHFYPMHGAVDDEPKFLWGSWQEQEYEDAKKEAEAAKRQLKAARKISQGRLQRIRKLTAKIKKRGAT